MERPILNKELGSKIFRDFYFLKEELVKFCNQKKLYRRKEVRCGRFIWITSDGAPSF